jgi:probable F420-dependent oxidoreductase
MRVGVNLINFGEQAQAATLVARAQHAEAMGYDFLMISDHVAITEDVEREYPTPFYDPFVSLSHLAAVTSRIELGTSVLVMPYRNPLLTARMASNLDQFSGGRMIFGVGVGWSRPEFEALGLDFDRRGPITDEYLSVVKQAWTREVFSFQGRFVAFSSVHSGPAPVRKPHPPLWVGGNSPSAIRRAVRLGTAWHPLYPTVDWLEHEAIPMLSCAAQQDDTAVPTLAPRVRLEISESPLDGPTRLAGQGTLEQIRDDLLRLEDLSISHVLLDTYQGPDPSYGADEGWHDVEQVAEHVLASFRQR